MKAIQQPHALSDKTGIDSLNGRAARLRHHILTMAQGKGEGYVGQGLGAADIFTVLYFCEMRHRPNELGWPDRDRFLLSTGHYSIVLWAALTELGIFQVEELPTYGADDSRLEMSSCETTPGVEITGGSLGHGLSQAIGMALGARLAGRDFRVFNFLSDGELQEGATWEAAMAAAHFKLNNLVALVDVNNMQADGSVSGVMTIEPVTNKWEAFGWHTQRVNGNSIPQLLAAFENVRAVKDQPHVVVCDTKMGYGVPMIEERAKAHFVRIEHEEWDRAFAQLSAREAP
jgi:transketolase